MFLMSHFNKFLAGGNKKFFIIKIYFLKLNN